MRQVILSSRFALPDIDQAIHRSSAQQVLAVELLSALLPICHCL